MRLAKALWLVALTAASIERLDARPIWGSTTRVSRLLPTRGGDSAPPVSETASTETDEKELSLDEKVQNAMKKLGLQNPSKSTEEDTATAVGGDECKDGVCPIPERSETEESSTNPHELAELIANDLGVTKDLAMATLEATGEMQPNNEVKLNEAAARSMIQAELDVIAGIPEDSEEVKTLVSEGHDPFLARRAVAFAERNMDDARAILEADRLDAEEEAKAEIAEAAQKNNDPAADVTAKLRAEAEAKKKAAPVMNTVSVDANFDPTAPVGGGLPGMPRPEQQAQQSQKVPPPANKKDVVFDASAGQIQKLIIESPVPVLVDVYADWCGPCKQLTPILEEMAVKGGGAFRLVKINTDNERAVSGALEVTALPTVFAVRDGKILNSFQGMPRSEEMMKSFMMGLLMPGATFDPPVTAESREKFAELSTKLLKVAGAAGFPFSQRERLQDRMATRLDELVQAYGGDMAAAEESAKVVRSLLSNVIRNPFEMKFRRVNMENRIISAKVKAFSPCVAMLKSVGFVPEEDGAVMLLGKNKNVVNVAPVSVARDCIDKWIDKNRAKIARDARRRHDELAREALAREAAERGDSVDDEEEEEEEEIDPNAVVLKVRLEGKKKVHEIIVDKDNTMTDVLKMLPVKSTDEEVQITCVAKKLIVRSSDKEKMEKSLSELGLSPAAALVVKIGDNSRAESSQGSLKERAAAKKSKKKGSHTMQSTGIYGKDDHLKGELIDGGGGTLFEHDVTDDEDEEQEPAQDSLENDEIDDEVEEEQS